MVKALVVEEMQSDLLQASKTEMQSDLVQQAVSKI